MDIYTPDRVTSLTTKCPPEAVVNKGAIPGTYQDGSLYRTYCRCFYFDIKEYPRALIVRITWAVTRSRGVPPDTFICAYH